MGMQIIVKDKNDAVKAEAADKKQAVLAWKDEYEEGDRIIFSLPEKNRFCIICVNDTMNEAFIYGTGNELVYEAPFAEDRTSYNPKSLTGERHYLTMRYARGYEIKSYRNLTKNVMDQHKGQECCLHAYANAGARGEAMFAARNTIGGVTTNLSHRKQPYESWRIDMQDDAQMTLKSGRPVDFDRIVLYTRADFPYDSWWEGVTFTFSGGISETVKLEKGIEPHIISLERRGIT